jgi:23S rRNA-/tRNA-specific pseudouridylate synthase
VDHRRDREASGLVVFARDPETHRELSLLFERKKVKKVYLAAVLGWLDQDGTVSRPIREFGSGRMGTGRGGKGALTRYRVLERLCRSSLLEVEPETGRRHQIRVHLYSRGHPILGDPLYGDPRPVGGVSRLMLHARSLAIPRPDGSNLALECPPPADFLAIVANLKVKAPGQ